MDNQPAKKIASIRTYAKDLELTRKEKGLPTESAKVTEDPPVSVSKTTTAVKKPVVKKEHLVADNPTQKQPFPQPKAVPEHKVKNFHKTTPTTVTDNQSHGTVFVVDNEDAAVATVITDTKKGRFKLFPAIVASISSWFAEKKAHYKTKKLPKYTVPESTRRKGVIQKATTKTGKLATSDFASIHERIRLRKEKDKQSDGSPTWSANTEPGFLLLEESENPQVANVKVEAKKSFRTPIPPPPAPKPTPKQPSKEVVTLPSVAAVTPETSASPTSTESVSLDEEKELAPESKEENQNLPARIRFLLTSTNTLALAISGIILGLIAIGATIYYLVEGNNESQLETHHELSSLLMDTDVISLQGENNLKENLLSALFEIREEDDEVVQGAFVYNNQEEELIPPPRLIEIFELTIEESLAQSITEWRSGYTSNKAPYLLMKATDSAAAMGGLLNWESTMYQDLNELFGLTTITTDLPQAFVDETIAGQDVRILKNELGSKLLVYSLLENTIIITTDQISYSELIKLIK